MTSARPGPSPAAAGEPALAPPPLDLRLAGAALGAWTAALGGLGGPAWRAWLAAALGGTAAVLVLLVRRTPSPAPADGHAYGADPEDRAARRRPRASRLRVAVAAVLVGVCAGSACTAARILTRDAEPLAGLAARRAAVSLDLVVRDDPRTTGGVRQAYVVAARLERVRVAGRSTVVGGRVLVLASDPDWAGLLPGQRVRAEGRLAPARAGDLTAAVLGARGAPQRLGRPAWFQRVAGGLREGLQRACQELPPEEGGLLPGLVVGDTRRMDPEVEQTFLATGMTHLTAVSGANVAIVTGLVLLVARSCRAGPRSAAVLAGLALVGFVILARPSPSVLRAAVMGALALLALAVGRPRAALPALAAAVLLLVLADPGLARSPGFALSVLATSGLLLLAPGWRDGLLAAGVPRGLAEALAVPAAAQVACAPVVAAMSGTVSLVAVPANLLAVPAVAPATVLGVAAAVVSPASPELAALLARLGALPARWLVEVARHGAEVPAGTVSWPGGTAGGLVLAGLVLAALLAGRRRSVRLVLAAVVAAGVLVALPVRVLAPGWPPADWVAVACDVGQGDALALRAGPGSAVLVDAGPDPAAVDRCLEELEVRRVPLLLLSHLHADHVGGLPGVFRRPVAAVGAGPYPEPETGRRLLADQSARHRTPVLELRTGAAYTIGSVRLEVLSPATAFTGTRSDPNNNSLVVRATVGATTVLLAGDAEEEAQRALLRSGAPLGVDVLKVAHHGSAYGEPAFLDAVRPRVALVSVGVGNDYGHPNPGVLARLERGGARVLRTDRDGDVAVVSREGRLAVVLRGAARAPP